MNRKVLKCAVLAIAVIAALSTLVLGVTYAALSYNVEINKTYNAVTEGLSIDGGAYHKEFSVTAAVSQTINIIKTDVEGADITAFDLILFTDNTESGVNAPVSNSYTLSTGAVKIYRNIPINDQGASLTLTSDGAANIRMAAIPYSLKNAFVRDLFQLKSLNNADLGNYPSNKLSQAEREDFKYVYILDGMVITEETVLNFPCYINLLYSDLTLNAPLTISHDGIGVYAIETVTGIIDNSGAVLSIKTLNGYCETGSVTFLSEANLTKESENVDFSSAASAQEREALLDDAEAFIKNYIPKRLYGDIALPSFYKSYGLSFAYTSDTESSVNSYGIVTRVQDTVSAVIGIQMSIYTDTRTVSADVSVVGVSEAAFVGALSDELRLYFSSKGAISLPVEISAIINDTVKSARHATAFTLSASDTDDAMFAADGLTSDSLTVSVTSGLTTYRFGSTEIDSANGIYIKPQELRFGDGAATITIVGADTGADGSFNINLKGITRKEQQEYLERYPEKLYFSTSSDTARLIYVDLQNGVLRMGSDEQIIISYTLGFNDVSYSIYLSDSADLEAVNAKTMTYQELIAVSADYSSYFDFTVPGTVKPVLNDVLSINSDESLWVYMDFEYADGTSYQTHRDVLIPAEGIGGSDYTEYIKGNTFGYYFDNLPGGRLIDSVADTESIPGNAEKFFAGTAGVNLLMRIETADVESFCSVIDSGLYHQINIDIDNIPAKNTYIEVLAIFYLTDINAPISEQRYGFTIPGIYRIGSDFADAAIYDAVINAVNSAGENYYASFGGYLLIDGASAAVKELDLSLSNLKDKLADDITDIRGIELLTGTESIVLDDVKIKDLLPFGNAGGGVIKKLSLKNAGISDSMLASGSLYALNRLEEIYLDGNAISGISGSDGSALLYRTVTVLSLNGQNNGILKELNGIDKLPYLVTLSVTDNAICNFSPLTSISTLKNVYLSGNTAVEFGGKSAGDESVYYGTNGLINIPVYVTLIDKGVKVYAENNATPSAVGSGKFISIEEYRGALILNAVVAFQAQFDKILFPSEAHEYTEDGVSFFAIDGIYVLRNGSAQEAVRSADGSFAFPSLTADGDSVKLIVKVNVGTTAVYKEFYFTARFTSGA